MKNYRQKLPPLDPLIAFEASARNLSFTKAGLELHLTQAAISQQIRSLENYLGVQLFIRDNRSVSLTPQGRNFQHVVATTLANLASATTDLRAKGDGSVLTIGCDQAIGNMLLMPKLPELTAAFPQITPRLMISDVEKICLTTDVDAAIIFGDGMWHGFHAEKLFLERIFPVCSPKYFKNSPELQKASDLSEHKLIELEDEHWNWMSWRQWLDRNGVNTAIVTKGLTVNSYPLVIEAATQGHGIALGWDHLVSREIANGTLINPLPDTTIESELGYYVLWPAGANSHPNIRGFIDWCLHSLIRN
ncbi:MULTISPECIES: LysR substrate-binding domain-containing protein [unclassified Pseudomonas]|uniref:LysR substrate-binding domain-containing protein n=1 Tax=unclassified Pseudomonas TaxID=196821 RepID=UPI0030D97F99